MGGGGLLSIVRWEFLEDSGALVHLRRNCLPPKKEKKNKNKLYRDLVVSCGLQLSDTIYLFFEKKKNKSKINRIQISVGEDLFLDTK